MSTETAQAAFPPVPDRYVVLGQIGRGASGTVFKARDRVIGRLVALKRLDLGQAADDEEREMLRQRFVREAQTAGRLAHRNVVTVYDVVKDAPDGATLIVMEWVEGESLKKRLSREKPLPPDVALDIASQIAEGLDYAHRNGVVHRDVKPANVLLSRDGRVMITDFGIARLGGSQLTLEGEVLGTPAYMAPEQILGIDISSRADIFALAAICYEMITAHPPFSGEQLVTVLHRIVHEPPAPPESWIPDLPRRASEVLLRSLAKNPEGRAATAVELTRDLREAFQLADRRSRLLNTSDTYRLRSDSSEVAAARTATNHLWRASFRTFLGSRIGKLALVITALLILAIGGTTWWLRRSDFVRAPSAAEAAEHRRQLEYLLFVREGRRMLDTGDPTAALRLFQEAANYAPPRNSLAELEEKAKQQIRLGAAAGKIEEAERAVSQGDYQEALNRVEEVMGQQGNDRQVSRLLTQIESGIRATISPANQGQEYAAQHWAVIDLEVNIRAPRGVCTIYAKDRQVLRRAVDYSDRPAAKDGVRGRFVSRLSLPAGPTHLRIYWSMAGAPTRLKALDARLAAHSERDLAINVGSDGTLATKLSKERSSLSRP